MNHVTQPLMSETVSMSYTGTYNYNQSFLFFFKLLPESTCEVPYLMFVYVRLIHG